MSESASEITSGSGSTFCLVNPHCLDNIVRLSDTFEVKASSDIVDELGTTLWSRGMQISREIRERMQRRRLRRPIEASLSVDAGISTETLVSDCLRLVDQNPYLAAIAGAQDARATLQSLRGITLTEPVRLVLTAAREQRQRDYEASLAAMIVCAGLASETRLSQQDAELLVLSALVHDVGEMYVKPEYLENTHTLSWEEWEHVVWHPCVGESFIREFAGFPAAIGDSVRQHHERPDGHGYPFRCTREQIGILGTLLGAADTVAALLLKEETDTAGRVSVALRVLPGEFPPSAITFIDRSLGNVRAHLPAQGGHRFADAILPQLQRLRSARKEATALLRGGHSLVVINVADLALDLLLRIDQSLRSTGVYDLSQLDALEQNPILMSRMRQVLDEIDWRLRYLARDLGLLARQNGSAQDLATLTVFLAGLASGPTASEPA